MLLAVTRIIILCFREALVRGIYTDKTLRDRFFQVEKMANRTALVKEEDSSLLVYLLSYIQSLVMASPSTEKVSLFVLY